MSGSILLYAVKLWHYTWWASLPLFYNKEEDNVSKSFFQFYTFTLSFSLYPFLTTSISLPARHYRTWDHWQQQPSWPKAWHQQGSHPEYHARTRHGLCLDINIKTRHERFGHTLPIYLHLGMTSYTEKFHCQWTRHVQNWLCKSALCTYSMALAQGLNVQESIAKSQYCK